MNKKYIITALTCIFIGISGICYSCAYKDNKAKLLLTAETGETNSSNYATNTDKTVNNNNKPKVNSSLGGENQAMDAITSATPNTSSPNTLSVITDLSQPQTKEQAVIYVHICGAVIHPGVYEAKTGARIVNLIKLAGGLTKDAAGDYINQAQLVTDGQRIYVPNKAELKELSTEEYVAGQQCFGTGSPQTSEANGSSNNTSASALININTADKEKLMSISGIGEAKATSIIAYREKNGKFSTIEELMNIPGIKEGLFNQISYMIVAK